MAFASILKVVLVALFIASSEEYGQRRRGDCPASQEEPWSYRGRNGPRFWGQTFPDCDGMNQSPISINSADAQRDENLAQLDMENYDKPITEATIENNGHSIELQPKDGVNRTISVNGKTYYLHQLHFHWGSRSYKGSEHDVDGVHYAMEMHLVHLSEQNDIAVVGVFFEEGNDNNEELQQIVDRFPDLKYKHSETELKPESSINLNNLLPSNPASFYRYDGSLTTPECAEGVVWSVLVKPISVGSSQMNDFRCKLYSVQEEDASKGCKLVNNFRPVQPQNDRQVLLSQ